MYNQFYANTDQFSYQCLYSECFNPSCGVTASLLLSYINILQSHSGVWFCWIPTFVFTHRYESRLSDTRRSGLIMLCSHTALRLTLELPSSISCEPRSYLNATTIPPPISCVRLRLNPTLGPPVFISLPLLYVNAAGSLSRHLSCNLGLVFPRFWSEPSLFPWLNLNDPANLLDSFLHFLKPNSSLPKNLFPLPLNL